MVGTRAESVGLQNWCAGIPERVLHKSAKRKRVSDISLAPRSTSAK